MAMQSRLDQLTLLPRLEALRRAGRTLDEITDALNGSLYRFTFGPASVRLRRSFAKRRRVWSSAAHNPLSCASDRATMCSISVSDFVANHRPVYGP